CCGEGREVGASAPSIRDSPRSNSPPPTRSARATSGSDREAGEPLTPPPGRKAGKMVEGDTPQAKAAELAKLLHDEAKVL
ncbi:MAG: hypothetical protein JRD04_08050, partial [Deltaproteobacteria bacterium]|nr:hypothetical protein [Deltaproteobacteria bacterium]